MSRNPLTYVTLATGQTRTVPRAAVTGQARRLLAKTLEGGRQSAPGFPELEIELVRRTNDATFAFTNLYGTTVATGILAWHEPAAEWQWRTLLTIGSTCGPLAPDLHRPATLPWLSVAPSPLLARLPTVKLNLLEDFACALAWTVLDQTNLAWRRSRAAK